MSDDDLRTIFGRVARTEAAHEAEMSFSEVVACVSDLTGESRQRVHDVCLDVEIPYEEIGR